MKMGPFLAPLKGARMPPIAYRAFTCIPGHWYKNFSHNGIRTMILRGIAWAGKRENIDELCKPAELGDALRYVEGGCPSPQELPKALEVHPEFNLEPRRLRAADQQADEHRLG
jgi:hypothetical protein